MTTGWTRAMLASASLCVVVVAACDPGDGGGMTLAAGDVEVFRRDVQPLFEARCASPTCHGGAGQPLEIYSPLRHRIDAAEVYRDTPLTEEELNLNQLRAACFVRDLDHGSTLSRKPLPIDEGGVQHEGGVIFEGAADPEYAPLRDWADATAAAQAEQEGAS